MTLSPKRIAIIVAALLGGYVAVVVLFESLIGVFQPEYEQTLVLITRDSEGGVDERVLQRWEQDDKLYVAVNHWPRRWYRRLLANPQVAVTLNGETAEYTAVRLMGPEQERIAERYDPGFLFRLLTGFPPRHFIRLDPTG